MDNIINEAMHAKVRDGLVSRDVAFGAGMARCSSASEFKARRIFFPALAAFKSNCLDAADLSPACREELLALIRLVEANAPTSVTWDQSMVRKAGV